MILLGSTGSIGTQAIQIAREYNINIEVLCAGNNIELLNKQIYELKPKIIVIKDSSLAHLVKKDNSQKLFFGESGILQAINVAESKLVINALVGISGLKPSLETLSLNKILALANKESLVVAGFLINCKDIIPIDSEHFALKELLKGRNNVKRLIITASGGAFRDTPLDMIASKSATEALKHPNWKMGNKITIDSATMVNKLFEILEARWLFNIENIDAYIEKNSIIHALLEGNDNNIFANFSSSDMRLPLSYAILGEKAKSCSIIKPLDLLSYSFKLEEICPMRYPLWRLKNEILKNPKLAIILNAANEVLVRYFLAGRISFGDISCGIYKALEYFNSECKEIKNIDDVIYLDSRVREFITIN